MSDIKLKKVRIGRRDLIINTCCIAVAPFAAVSIARAESFPTVPYTFTSDSDRYVESFVRALSRADYTEAFKLFDPNAESYSREQFVAMNQYFATKVGAWSGYKKISTTFRKVHDEFTDTTLMLPAYLYRVELDRFSTPLLLVLFMDGTKQQPGILGYDFMPKETVQLEGLLRLWRRSIS